MPRTGSGLFRHPKAAGKGKMMSLKMPMTMAKTIRILAKQSDISESAFMREALTSFIRTKQEQIVVESEKVNTVCKAEPEEIKITPEMLALVREAEMPEEEDFADKLLHAKSRREIEKITFGRASQGGWEVYTREQDPEYGWNLEDAIHFRNTLLLLMIAPERFRKDSND